MAKNVKRQKAPNWIVLAQNLFTVCTHFFISLESCIHFLQLLLTFSIVILYILILLKSLNGAFRTIYDVFFLCLSQQQPKQIDYKKETARQYDSISSNEQ